MPVCSNCGRKMRTAKVEPHARIRNILVRSLVCTCGHTARDLVAGVNAPEPPR